ncbi:MAG: hypothetical protein Q7S27_06100 [Nanoarchaeota archaeon]|nr:hypothetical protein [Nanoarchaeota archaeon]
MKWNKNNNKKSHKFSPKPKRFETEPEERSIGEITKEDLDNNLLLVGFIDKIQQTAGPTVFFISDGTGTLALKGFVGPGERAYPEIGEGDAVNVKIKLSEFREAIEGEILSIKKLMHEEKDNLIKEIREIEMRRADIKFESFMVEDKILEKLKNSLIKAAKEIRLAIIQNRPIIVRHHNDADGYSAGYALEKSIIPLIEKQHGGGKSPWEYYTRAPCAAPFYEIDDSIRDTAHSLANEAKFSNKMPLIIIADNGSSQEDLLAILQGKVHGIDFIVVDHHYFEEDVISEQTLVHINPFLVGEDGAKYSAGMLCSELAKLINNDAKVEQIPAMAGMADRIDNPKAIEGYLKIAEKKGYNKDLLLKIASVIDFTSSKLRFMEAREFIEVLFGEPMEKQKELVALLDPYIKKQERKGIEIAKKAVKIEKIKEVTLQLLYVEENFRRGFYPKPGKCTGLIHDDIQSSKKLTKVVTAGVLQDAVTMRATDEANFSVHELIEYMNKHIPEAFVEGGGHKNAGAITFIPSKQKEVVEALKEYIKSK